MDRIPDIDQERVDYWRAWNHDQAAVEGVDADLPPEERRDREEVIAGSFLKRDDDITIQGSIIVRVVGPARGATCVLTYYPPWFGDDAMAIDIPNKTDITDRAPFDPEEEPMPVFPPEEPPPDPEEPPPEPEEPPPEEPEP